jgi:hypothetical protein
MTAADATQAVIDRVVEHLDGSDIKHVIVATTSGETGVRFAEALAERDVRVVAVTHHVGFRGGDVDQLEASHRKRLDELSAAIITAPHALSGVNRSISGTFGGTTSVEIIAHTLRLFGQGMKVCVEIAVMAADAGWIPTDCDVICVGGTGRGADTAVVLRPAHSNSFFDLRVGEILCRPAGA